MRAAAVAALLLSLVISSSVGAAESLWTVAIVGRRDVVMSLRPGASGMPMADVHLLAPDLSLAVSARNDAVAIRDVNGVEWQTANGSTRLDGPLESRPLVSPVMVMQDSVFLPLDAIAQLAGRNLVLEDRGRALLMPPATAASSRPSPSASTSTPAAAKPAGGDIGGPLGWQAFDVPKTAEERDAMARENDDFIALRNRPSILEDLPSGHEVVGLDLGLGFAQRGGAAIDATGGGTISGYRLGLAGFLTANTGGATFRSGRVVLESPSASWTAEAGDLLSEMRGLARGVRFSRRVTSHWRPGVSFYINDPRVPGDRAAVAYRDDLLLTRNVDLRGEASSDGSNFIALRFIAGKGNVETFHRYASGRDVFENGLAVSYNVGRGVSAYGGARVSTGGTNDRWNMVGVAVPLYRGSSFTLEQARNERQGSSDVAHTLGLQLPFGPVRVIQRYTQTDVALLDGPSLFESGRRQLQSMASYAPNSRLRFTYQVGTQWYAGSDARQWTELESALRVSRSMSVHAVTGFPDVTDPFRLRIGVQQQLPHAFRLSVDYGHLPAFESPVPLAPEAARLLVMVRRTWNIRTPAAGSDVEGFVRDDSGAPVAGVAVALGPYLTMTGVNGSYRFGHVPPGDHELSVAVEHLPAAFGPGEQPRVLKVGPNAPAHADIGVTALRAIHGRVFMDRNGNGRVDEDEGIAGVVVRLDDRGTATLTNQAGGFDFYNLEPGTYSVWIDASRLNADLELASTGRLEVDLQPDRPATNVDFRLAVHDKPVVIQDLP
jgi:hypothetical protein